MTDVIIRKIRQDDVDGFRAALGSVAAEGRWLATTTLPPLEKTQAFVASNIKNNYPQFVVEKDGTIIGWCDIFPRDVQDLATGVLGMGLVATERGKGYGRALIEATVNAAKEFGFQTIRLDVRTDNAAAIALYKKIGFEIEREYSRAEKCGGVALYDMVLAQ